MYYYILIMKYFIHIENNRPQYSHSCNRNENFVKNLSIIDKLLMAKDTYNFGNSREKCGRFQANIPKNLPPLTHLSSINLISYLDF